LTTEYGRYRYRRIPALLRDLSLRASKERLQRIWQRERLKVP
jgi:putative transposase